MRTDDGRPLYQARFHEALKFHSPGLAPVLDASGAYHITPDGLAAYPERYLRTFGFYEGIAAVHSTSGWHHIGPDGAPRYVERYAWCGNFQEGRCSVRDDVGRYFHIAADGSPAYPERYRYAGDFRDGHAVVQNDSGVTPMSTPTAGCCTANGSATWTYFTRDTPGRPTPRSGITWICKVAQSMKPASGPSNPSITDRPGWKPRRFPERHRRAGNRNRATPRARSVHAV